MKGKRHTKSGPLRAREEKGEQSTIEIVKRLENCLAALRKAPPDNDGPGAVYVVLGYGIEGATDEGGTTEVTTQGGMYGNREVCATLVESINEAMLMAALRRGRLES